MKKVLALVLSMAMLFTGIPATAFAADGGETPAEKTQMKITMLHETKNNPSMCDAMFAETADLESKGDNVEVKIYVANPVPGFPDQGADGTVKNVKFTYDGKVYNAVSDITTKPMMTAKADNPLFGLEKGKQYSAQVLTVELPKAALKENGIIKVDAFVNVVMNSDVVFRMQMTDVVIPEEPPVVPEYAYGTTSMNVTMLHESKDNPSMCDAMFAEKADLTSKGENVEVKIYVANPVPGFPDQGADGTVKNVKFTYDGKEYEAVSDITTKPMMTAKTDNPLFGLEKGKQYSAQVLTVELPKAALTEKVIPVEAFVNVVMNTDVNFRMKLDNVVIPEADKTLLAKKVEIAKALETEGATKESAEALNKAIAGADAVIADRNATDEAVSAAIEALDIAVDGLKPEEAEKPEPSVPDYKNLEDGIYLVHGNMLKPSGAKSMADDAINHNIKLTVKDGKYSLTLNFKGITMGDKFGYLGELEYFLTGYEKDQYNSPVGKTAKATVEKLMLDENGKPVEDMYGTDYPSIVSFDMIPEALEDGMVPLQVNVPVMDSIAPGLGTQQVYLALDWDTVEETTADDDAFLPLEDDEKAPADKEDAAKPDADRNDKTDAEKEDSAKAPVTGDAADMSMMALVLLAAGTVLYGIRRKAER